MKRYNEVSVPMSEPLVSNNFSPALSGASNRAEVDAGRNLQC